MQRRPGLRLAAAAALLALCALFAAAQAQDALAAPSPAPAQAAPSPSPAPAAEASPSLLPAPAATGGQAYSLVLRLHGAWLTPWTARKATKLLGGVTAALDDAGLAATPEAALLMSATNVGGAAAAADAGIPALGTATQVASAQVVVRAGGGKALELQAALQDAVATGELAVQLRLHGEP